MKNPFSLKPSPKQGGGSNGRKKQLLFPSFYFYLLSFIMEGRDWMCQSANVRNEGNGKLVPISLLNTVTALIKHCLFAAQKTFTFTSFGKLGEIANFAGRTTAFHCLEFVIEQEIKIDGLTESKFFGVFW
jgi:hypothetical protein